MAVKKSDYTSRTRQRVPRDVMDLIEEVLTENEGHRWVPVRNDKGEGQNCGTGAGGFKPGNTCAGGKADPRESEATPKGERRFKMRVVNPDARDTQEAYMHPDGTWTRERKALHDELKKELFRGKTPVRNPVAYVMGGGPAAGKSTIIKKLQLPENLVMIAADEMKEKLPEYEKGNPRSAGFVHEESSTWAKRMQREASEGGYNTLLDGTGDSEIHVLRNRIDAMKKQGQRVVAHYVTVDIDTAIARSMERARKTGRYMPESVLRATHSGVSRTVPLAIKEGLFDEFTLWDSSGEGGHVKVATARGKELKVHQEKLWKKFLDKGRE